jgi:hypothetical protein
MWKTHVGQTAWYFRFEESCQCQLKAREDAGIAINAPFRDGLRVILKIAHDRLKPA